MCWLHLPLWARLHPFMKLLSPSWHSIPQAADKLAQLAQLTAENERLKARHSVLERAVAGRSGHVRGKGQEGPMVLGPGRAAWHACHTRAVGALQGPRACKCSG
jgi:hypothetical protein